MKFLKRLSAGLLIAASAYSISHAQPDTGDNAAGPEHGGRGALRAACQTDVDKFCSDVAAGGGRVMQCVRQHQDELSDGCKAAIQNAHEHHRHDGAPSDGPQTSAPAPQG